MSKRLAAVAGGIVQGLTAVLPKWRRIATHAELSARLVPRVRVDTAHGPLSFYTPSKTAVYWPRHALAAEPETLRWIDAMPAGSVLWDIGASVGVYALYAARRGGLEVLAFEANPFTFHCLLKNVQENRLQSRLKPYCLALAEKPGLGAFYVASLEAGTVGNAFGDSDASMLRESAGPVEIATFGLSIDALVALGAPAPDYIKLDVDSIEDRILAGGHATLADRKVKGVLVELVRNTADDTRRAESIIATMTAHGFAVTIAGTAASPNCLFTRGE